MKIEIKILTPVHIGSGESIFPIEYISVNKNNEISPYRLSNKIIRINMASLFKDKKFKQFMGKFTNSVRYKKHISEILPKEILLKHILYKIDISQNAFNSNLTEIKEFIKSAGRVYIPGSSLKGSLLSGVIYGICKKYNIRNIQNYNSLLSNIFEKISDTPKKEFSHWLDVTDTNLLSSEESLEISKCMTIGGKRSIPILYETLKTGTTFEAEMKTSIPDILKFGKLSPEEILNYANEFYRKIYKKQEGMSPRIPQNYYLLRLGQGSSVLSTSLLLIAEELDIKNYSVKRRIRGRDLLPIKPGEKPRTRKLIGGKIPMGWVEVEKK